MDAPVLAAITTGSLAFVASVCTGIGTVWSSRRNAERSNENARAIKAVEIDYDKLKSSLQRQKEVAVYTEPLARAAYDLQSRLWNILRGGFLHAYLANGTEQTREYAVNNTVYLLAQYLCWMEIARRELQFIDLGEDEKTRLLLATQDKIYRLWGTSKFPPPLRIFAGDQRALGEALIETSSRGLTCMGYGAFLSKYTPGTHKLIDSLRADMTTLPGNLDRVRGRLIEVQHALIDILDILDPDKIRFPVSDRTKFTPIEPLGSLRPARDNGGDVASGEIGSSNPSAAHSRPVSC